MSVEIATTTSYRKRHLSADLVHIHPDKVGQPSAWGRPGHNGRIGHALCNGSTEVIDQVAVNERHETRLYGNVPSVERMDECKACAKKAAKLAAPTP